MWLACRWSHQLCTILCDKGVASAGFDGQAGMFKVLSFKPMGSGLGTTNDDTIQDYNG